MTPRKKMKSTGKIQALKKKLSRKLSGPLPTIETKEEDLIERDPAFDEWAEGVRDDATRVLRTSLATATVRVKECSTFVESLPAEAEWGKEAIPKIVGVLLEVQNLLATLSLCLSLNLPSASDSGTGFSAAIQASLAEELRSVWKSCSDLTAIFTTGSMANLRVIATEKFSRAEDAAVALHKTTLDVRFLTVRYLVRITGLLLTLTDIVQKNGDRISLKKKAPSS